MSVGASIASQSRSEGFNRSWKWIVIKKKFRRERTTSMGVTPLNCTLGSYPNGILASCKRGGFMLQRSTKLVKELIAQNPPQDCLQTRASSGLVFAKQSAAADVAGGSKQAAVESKQDSLQCKVRDKVQKWREMRNARLSLRWYSVARGRQQENSHIL